MAASNVDYQQARDRANVLLVNATQLYSLIDQNQPHNPGQFSAAIQLIDHIQTHLNGLRAPIQHLSQQTNIRWVTDNIDTSSGSGWVGFSIGLLVGAVMCLILRGR